jgi:TetR/AcrR family transcriptional regulator, cholesterol catabolism regulator
MRKTIDIKKSSNGRRRLFVRADSKERWKQILELSGHLFYQKGFVSTSMEDVSDAVGLLKGSLYHYIRSKEDLLFEVLEGLHVDGEEIIAAVHFESDDPMAQLRQYLKRAAIFAGNNAERLVIFFRDFDKVRADRRSEIISEREMYTQTVARLLTEAKAKGLTAPTLDVRLASKLLSGAISSTHEWLRPHGRRPLEDAAEEIASLLLEGITPKSSRKVNKGTRNHAKSNARAWTRGGRQRDSGV